MVLRRIICTSRMADGASLGTIMAARNFVRDFNDSYERVHRAFEGQFWGTKMALKASVDSSGADGEARVVGPAYSAELLAQTKGEMEGLLSDPSVLEEAKVHRNVLDGAEDDEEEDLAKTLDIIIRTCECNSLPTARARSIREETCKIESDLEMARNAMVLGYYRADPVPTTDSVGDAVAQGRRREYVCWLNA